MPDGHRARSCGWSGTSTATGTSRSGRPSTPAQAARRRAAALLRGARHVLPDRAGRGPSRRRHDDALRPHPEPRPRPGGRGMTQRWQASFITAADHTGEPDAPAPYLRQEFTVEDGLVRATLHVTALGLVEAHLNGAVVGDEVLAPGWTSYRHRLVVSTHDVTDLVVAGANVLGAIVGEGWAVGRLGWQDHRQIWAERPAAFLQLELDYGDRTDVIGSDTTWRATTGAVRANSLYDGEAYDARLEPDGWSHAGFDDGDWGEVEVVDWDLGTLIAPSAPPIRRIEEVAAVEVLTTPTGRTVVDFGQNLTGWVRLDVCWARRDHDHPPPLRDVDRRRAGVRDQPHRARHRPLHAAAAMDPRRGSRASRSTGSATSRSRAGRASSTTDDLTAVVVHSDMRRIGWFESSNELLNQLHDNVVWSMRGNFVGVPTDCPQRDERLGWTGDINAFAPTAAFLYDVARRAGLVAGGSRGRAEPSRATCRWSFRMPSADPRGTHRAVGRRRRQPAGVPLRGLRRSRDPRAAVRVDDARSSTRSPRVLDEHGVWSQRLPVRRLGRPRRAARQPRRRRRPTGTSSPPPSSPAPPRSWPRADVLGRADDATRYQALHERVRAGFRRRVGDAGRARRRPVRHRPTPWRSASACSTPSEEARRAPGWPSSSAKADHRISTGFAGTPYVTEALSRTGHLDTAYALLLETELPVVPVPGHHGRDDDLGAVGRHPSRRLPQPHGHDLAQPLRARCRGFAGCIASSAAWLPSRPATADCGSRRNPAVGSPMRPPPTTRPHGRARVAWQLRPRRAALVVEARCRTAPPPRSCFPSTPTARGAGGSG